MNTETFHHTSNLPDRRDKLYDISLEAEKELHKIQYSIADKTLQITISQKIEIEGNFFNPIKGSY